MTITISINTDLSKDALEQIADYAEARIEEAIMDSFYDSQCNGYLEIEANSISVQVINNNDTTGESQ